MATKKTTKKGSGKKKGDGKAALHRQLAIRRLAFSVVGTILMFFALFQTPGFGDWAYNFVRLLFGSLAYLAIFVFIFRLFGFRWIQRHEGLFSGFIMFFSGLLLAFQTYLAKNILAGNGNVLVETMRIVVKDVLEGQGKNHFAGGGVFGVLLYIPSYFLFSNFGSYLIAVLLIIFGGLIMSPLGYDDLVDWITIQTQEWGDRRQAQRHRRQLRRQELLAQRESFAAEQAQTETRLVDMETGEIIEPSVPGIQGFDRDDVPAFSPYEEAATYDYAAEMESFDAVMPEAVPDVATVDFSDDEEEVTMDFSAKEDLGYKLPPITLFEQLQSKSQLNEQDIAQRNMGLLQDTFNSFGVDVKVIDREIGPSVTKYIIKPNQGVRVNRITGMADDIALALAAKDVRIEAPIPGKPLIGIEVPNSEIATVGFRELWEQSKTDPDKLLEIPLGKAVNGAMRTFDLSRMPHLLVAGSTGSGKSVAVNGIIASILMKARPDQVKFMMVDPKMVELSVYNDIPHLLIPVVTNPRKAARALQKVVDEMEKRYELFSKIGVRNIAGYNARVEANNAQSDFKEIPLPLIVVIVDELADLMMVASKEVEDAIIRLGQKARAAGIHMILATQRPSVDVISGLIKANVPSRIAFAVSSGTDSRTILDINGAEKLLGRGDMLFKPIDENHPVRLQGSFISDEEVERVVNFIKRQADAEYDESFDPGEVADNEVEQNIVGVNDGDPLFEQAKALVIETQKASASMIQRRLSVGFNRATRLMEELEAAGIIGPAVGTKPRKVLMTGVAAPEIEE